MTQSFAYRARWLLRRTCLAADIARVGLLFAVLTTAPVIRAETLTLADCLRETALHNPSVVLQARAVEAAAGTALTLRSRALPSLAIGGLIGQQGAEGDAKLVEPAGRNASGQEVYVQVDQKRPSQFLAIGTETLYQPLFDAAILPSWHRATVEIAAAQANYYSAAVVQLYTARILFNQALYFRESGLLLAGIDHSYETDIKTVANMVNAGLSSRQSLLQAETQRVALAPVINSTTGSYRTTLTALLATMGREQRAVNGGDLVANVRLDGALDNQPFFFDPRTAARQALIRRSDLEVYRTLIKGYHEDARIYRSGYFPLVRVYVAGELIPQSFVRSSRPNALRAGDEVQTSEIRPGARYDWNVIDTGTVSGTAQSIDRTRESLEISLHHMEQNIPSNLARLRAQLDDAAATMKAATGNLAVAQDTLNITTALVAQGTGTQLDFDNAQNGLLSTRSSLLQAQLLATNARTEFDSVTGGYLRFVPAAEPYKKSAPARAVK